MFKNALQRTVSAGSSSRRPQPLTLNVWSRCGLVIVSIPKQLIQILLLGTALIWHSACAPVHVDSQLAGEYLHTHTVSYFDGEKSHELEEIDKLVITPAGRGLLRFSIDTVANNGHTCSMNGVASEVGDHFEFREPVHLDSRLKGGESPECVLELRVADQQIELKDVNHNCRLYYCGMRAKLDGLTFLKVTAGQTLENQPAEPKEDAVLAIPGLPLKLRSGFGCADHADHSRSSRIMATDPFEIQEICFGDTKGPDMKHDFKWFRILNAPVNSLQISYPLPPGLVLSIYPRSTLARDGLRWQETTGSGFVEWSLIERLPKFTMVGLKYYRAPEYTSIIFNVQKNKSFKWREKVYDCADLEQPAPPGFRRVFLYDYCWFEKATGPDILPKSF